MRNEVEILKNKSSRFFLYNVWDLAKFNREKHKLKSSVTLGVLINILWNFKHIRYVLE